MRIVENRVQVSGQVAVMSINGIIRNCIFRKGTLSELKKLSKESGFMTIRDAAIQKWLQGLTTLEEVLGETFE